MILKTNYRDSIYSEKKYRITDNGDGTCAIEDKTVYADEGDYYGAGDINKQNLQTNTLVAQYPYINQIIAKLRTYGITISDYSSPSDIVSAIQTIATNRYNSGRTTGRNRVTSDPNSYNLYSESQYMAQASLEDNYRSAIEIAYSALLSSADSYNSYVLINSQKALDTQNYANGAVKKDMNAQTANAVRNQTSIYFNHQKASGNSEFLAYKSQADNVLRVLAV